MTVTPGDSAACLTDFLLDEAAAERLAEALRGVGVVVCESQYRHDDEELACRNFHMTATPAASLAKQAGPFAEVAGDSWPRAARWRCVARGNTDKVLCFPVIHITGGPEAPRGLTSAQKSGKAARCGRYKPSNAMTGRVGTAGPPCGPAAGGGMMRENSPPLSRRPFHSRPQEPFMNARVWLPYLAPILAAAAACTAAEPPAPEVPVVRPVVREVTDAEVFTGRTEASAAVELRARVTGYLDKVLFKDGDDVKQGDVLFEIDPRPYRAEREKAQAVTALAEARLKQADDAGKRAAALLASKAISQEDLDKAVADRAEAEAALAVARAGLAAAKLALDFSKVAAPFDGRVGRRLVDPGGLVKADDTVLAVLSARDLMCVAFDVDERTALRQRRAVREGKPGAKGEAELPVAMGLADEEGFPHPGKVDFIDNRVDPDKGTLRMRAVFANADGLLVPGLSARVRLAIGGPYKALLVPAEAVGFKDGQWFVLVVGEKDVVEWRTVVEGPRQDGSWTVKEGLRENDRVVVGGPKGLRPGTTVRPREASVPAPAAPGGRDEENKQPRAEAAAADSIAAVFSFPRQSTLDDKQQEALLALKKEYTPRLEDLDARIEKLGTPGQERTVGQQLKAGLTLKALRAERDKLLGEIEERKTALLTDGQKALLPKAADPGKGP